MTMSISTDNGKLSSYSIGGITRINRDTQHEEAETISVDYPYRQHRFSPSDVPGRFFPWHWHDDAECFYVARGALVYYLPGTHVVFHAGDAGLINTRILHMTQPENDAYCEQQVHVFHPSLIHSSAQDSIAKQYILPLATNKAASVLRFSGESEEAAASRRWMDTAYSAAASREPGWEFAVREAMTHVWMMFLAHMPPAETAQDFIESTRLRTMLQYINNHFDKPISLQDIASSANVSKKECERCFQRTIGLLPFEQVMRCRLDTARRMLLESDLSITEIAVCCGFSSSSYFGKSFRLHYGISPSAYRLSGQKHEQSGSFRVNGIVRLNSEIDTSP